MDDASRTRVSKRLSYHLRHAPAEIGLELGSGGWVAIDDLLTALAAHGATVTRAELEEVVTTNDKQRFAVDGELIRASQGHSVAVDLDLDATAPPPVLFHGTVDRFLDAIWTDGLLPMSRHDVHLSASLDTARAVGARRGAPVVLVIDAAAMSAAGHEFRMSANGVWLVSAVPPEYLSTREFTARLP